MRHEPEIRHLRSTGLTQRRIAATVGCSPSHVHKVLARQDQGVVYYIAFADRVKIGYTANLQQRLFDIPCDELLAIEPGDVGTEVARHERFAHLRITGEWFERAPELEDLVRQLRQEHPLPRVPVQRRYAAWARATSFHQEIGARS